MPALNSILMVIFLLCFIAISSEVEHSYEEGEEVVLWYNRGVLPLSPSDSYSFYDIPLCRGKRNYAYPIGLANSISGIEPLDSGMPISYLKDSHANWFCNQRLSPDQFNMLEHSIQLGLLAEFYIDGLPMWVEIGKIDEGIHLFTTYHLTIHYNLKNIIKVSIQPDNPLLIYDIENDTRMVSEFSLKFSVSWIPTEENVNYRMNIYYEMGIFNTSIHWFSLLNSTAIILIVCGMILLLMYKTLSNDLKKYESAVILDMPSGWKQLRNEIWRPAKYNFLFAAMISIGVEISIVLVSWLCFNMLAAHVKDRALALMIFFSGYAGGFVSSSLNQTNKDWIASTLFGSCFIPVVAWIIILIYIIFLTGKTWY